MKLKEIKEQGKSVFPFIIAGATIVILYFVILNLGKIWSVFTGLLSVLSPVFIGFVIAYLLNRPIDFFENKLFIKFDKKKNQQKLRRSLSIAVVYIIALYLIFALIKIVIPQIITSVSQLVSNYDSYWSDFQLFIQDFSNRFNIDINNTNMLPTKIADFVKKFDVFEKGLQTFYNLATGLGSSIINFVIGLVFGIYFNNSK